MSRSIVLARAAMSLAVRRQSTLCSFVRTMIISTSGSLNYHQNYGLPSNSYHHRGLQTCQSYRSTDTIDRVGPFAPPKQMTFEEVEERVMKAIAAWDRFPEDRKNDLNLDSNFVNDLGLDSLDHVEIVMSLEDEFGFEIPDSEAEKLKTPRDIFKYICEHEDVYE